MVIFAHPILGSKIEMHEKYQSRISCLLNYDRWLVFIKKRYTMLNLFGNNIAVAIFFEHETRVDVKVNRSNLISHLSPLQLSPTQLN